MTGPCCCTAGRLQADFTVKGLYAMPSGAPGGDSTVSDLLRINRSLRKVGRNRKVDSFTSLRHWKAGRIMLNRSQTWGLGSLPCCYMNPVTNNLVLVVVLFLGPFHGGSPGDCGASHGKRVVMTSEKTVTLKVTVTSWLWSSPLPAKVRREIETKGDPQVIGSERAGP